jgi:hypothetical protein
MVRADGSRSSIFVKASVAVVSRIEGAGVPRACPNFGRTPELCPMTRQGADPWFRIGIDWRRNAATYGPAIGRQSRDWNRSLSHDFLSQKLSAGSLAQRPAKRSGIGPFIVMDVMREANAKAASGGDVELGQPTTRAPYRLLAQAPLAATEPLLPAPPSASRRRRLFPGGRLATSRSLNDARLAWECGLRLATGSLLRLGGARLFASIPRRGAVLLIGPFRLAS